MSFQAVLFDLDGTLLDTLEDLASAMNRVLAKYSFPSHQVEAYKNFIGDGIESLVRRALPAGHPESMVPELVEAMREEYGKHMADNTRPYKGIPELLDSLTGRGLKLAILSNKPDEPTKSIITRFFPHWRFNPVWGARPEVPKKPDPTAALEVAERLNILPHHFVYLGDSATDMKTALGAGMYPVGALWGFRTAEELTNSGAKALIQNPMELLDLL